MMLYAYKPTYGHTLWKLMLGERLYNNHAIDMATAGRFVYVLSTTNYTKYSTTYGYRDIKLYSIRIETGST